MWDLYCKRDRPTGVMYRNGHYIVGSCSSFFGFVSFHHRSHSSHAKYRHSSSNTPPNAKITIQHPHFKQHYQSTTSPSYQLAYASPLRTSIRHSQPGSQSAFAAIGGYCVSSFSTFGSQVHQELLSTLSITEGMCWPQPHQDVLSGGREG